MDVRPNPSCDAAPGAALASGLGWAQRVLRRQLHALSRLASVALNMLDKATQAAADSVGVVALERALRVHGRMSWVLRLIEALEAKLTDDLCGAGRGEMPDFALEAKVSESRQPALKTPLEHLHGEKLETERGERLDYERFDLGRDDREFAEIPKRPTDEIIALICRELGLSPDWPRLTEEAWERRESERAGRDRPEPPSPSMGEGSGTGVAPCPANPQTG